MSDALYHKPPSKPKKPTKLLKVPTDLEEILFLHPDEAVYFNDLSPSHKNEYIKYIWEAKPVATRSTRALKVIEMLREKMNVVHD